MATLGLKTAQGILPLYLPLSISPHSQSLPVNESSTQGTSQCSQAQGPRATQCMTTVQEAGGLQSAEPRFSQRLLGEPVSFVFCLPPAFPGCCLKALHLFIYCSVRVTGITLGSPGNPGHSPYPKILLQPYLQLSSRKGVDTGIHDSQYCLPT